MHLGRLLGRLYDLVCWQYKCRSRLCMTTHDLLLIDLLSLGLGHNLALKRLHGHFVLSLL